MAQRIMLKLSGEMLGGEGKAGLATQAVEVAAQEIADAHNAGYEIAVVVGGGNIFRGSQAADLGMERAAGDHMGMLATCVNGLALQSIIESKHNIHTRVMTAIHMPEFAEPYIRRKAIKHLRAKRVVIFAGGTGNPLFTTDTAASLRAQEVGSEMILKATKVDGIYDRDPDVHADAKKYQEISYLDVVSKKLQVMDATAVTMCMEAKLPVLVFKLSGQQSVLKVLADYSRGTIVR